MTAQVANIALSGSSARYTRIGGASARQMVDGIEGSAAAFGRGRASQYVPFDSNDASRQGEFQDQVVSYGGVLVSLDVGTTIMQAQALNGLTPTAPGDAERQVANYEFTQSLSGSDASETTDSATPYTFLQAA